MFFTTLKNTHFFFLLFFLCLGKIQAQRNVILIIADDLGSDYCGFSENHLDTVKLPNVRKLLATGVWFRNAWSNPLCSPTRAGILTGRYSIRTGVGNAVGGQGSAVLDTSEKTIPKLLNAWQPQAISKANIGKWHLSLPMPVSNYIIPNQIGYDHFEGNFTGVLNSYTNWTKITNGVASNNTNYATTETANNAISWIKNQPPGKPFFAWLAFNAPHTPFHLPPSNLHSYTSLSGSDADINANPKSYFKAAVEALDHEIGRIFDSLKVIDKYDSTDIIFIGDNGDDALVSQVTGGAKGTVYQEGVSVPFIISGPSVVNPNRVSNALVNTQDLFATILEMFGNTNWSSQIPANKPVDSKSIMPVLKAQTDSIRPWAFTEVFKNPATPVDGKAMRNRDYKLLDFDNGTQRFYRISTDPDENQNLLLNTLSTEASSQYTFLCQEMTNLVGIPRFCDLTTANTETIDEDRIFIYYTPDADYFKISGSVAGEVQLYNVSGKSLSVLTKNEDNAYSLSGISSGVYILKIQTSKGPRALKLLVTNW